MFRSSVTRRFARSGTRSLASAAGPLNPGSAAPFQVFDRNLKVLHKDLSATLQDGERSRTVDYVRNEVADRMVERLMVRCIFWSEKDAPAHSTCIGHKTKVQQYLGLGLWTGSPLKAPRTGHHREGCHVRFKL